VVVVRKRQFDLTNPEDAARYIEHLKAASARRVRVTKDCPVCGKSFTGLATKRYCSPSCRQKHYLQELAKRPPTGGPDA
jgi:hypothetical protein